MEDGGSGWQDFRMWDCIDDLTGGGTRKTALVETLATVPSAVLDQFAPDGPLSAADVEAVNFRFKKALIERALDAELSHHLGYPPGGHVPDDTPNHRNGASGKTVITDDGPLAIAVPRDRAGTCAPQLIPKHARRFTGFDDKILALYARGLTVREIQAFLLEMYAVEVSPDPISTVTDAIMAGADLADPAARADVPVVFFDALRGAGDLARWHTRHPRRVDRADRRREVLDEGLRRSAGAGVSRHSDCRDRRTHGHERGAGRGLSRDDAPNVPRAPDPQQPGLHWVEGAQAVGGRDGGRGRPVGRAGFPPC